MIVHVPHNPRNDEDFIYCLAVLLSRESTGPVKTRDRQEISEGRHELGTLFEITFLGPKKIARQTKEHPNNSACFFRGPSMEGSL